MTGRPYSNTYLRNKKRSLKFKRLAIKRQLRKLGYSSDDLVPISGDLRALRKVRAEYVWTTPHGTLTEHHGKLTFRR